MITLHYHPSNASFAPHILLREMGLPFQLELVDRDNMAHKTAGYLKMNPNGLIPVLQDGDLVLYETAAILLHLSDTHPEAGLAPAVGTAERAEFYKWLIWLTNTLQPLIITYYYPHRCVAEGNEAGTAEVKKIAEERVGPLLDQLDALLASHGGPWLLGERFTVADPLAFMLCRWTRNFARPARSLPHIGAYLNRMLERPAVAETIAVEKLPQPWI
jgi:glutathione S-transferase